MGHDTVDAKSLRAPGDYYPPLSPYNHGMLPVSDGHTIYFEESGNPRGLPILFVHGGPGGGTDDDNRRFFNPERYRIILFDQRGCGRSLPYASLENNTTWHLVADMEALRQHLGIDSWMLFGGSWGSTLSMAYYIKHWERAKGCILRGIYFGTKKESIWAYRSGLDNIFPDHWRKFIERVPPGERRDLVAAYYRQLTSEDPAVRLAAAKSWSIWEAVTSKLLPDDAFVEEFSADTVAVAIARIECHYFMNNCWFTGRNQLLSTIRRMRRRVPCIIINGRYDMVCPMSAAHALHLAWPESELVVIADAGHSSTETGTRQALIAATDRFSTLAI